MIAPRIAFLFVAAAILAGCAIPVRTDPAVSASGDRYDALDGTDTRFWSKGDRAVVTVRGVDLPQCRAASPGSRSLPGARSPAG